MAMLAVADLRKSFLSPEGGRIDVVRVGRFGLAAGEQLALRGESGSGKTTFLHLIAGILTADSGRIEVCGIDSVREPERARASVGYLSTDLSVYNRFTPRELLKLFGEFQGVEAAVAERRGIHLLERLHMADFADVRMEGFSGGQKQKVSIARALLHDPKVVIFDEPTTGLDVLTAKTVLDLLRIMKAEGRSIIVSTHVMPMVEAICDRVGIIFEGLLHGDAGPREILDRWGVATLDEVFFQLVAEKERGVA